MKDNKRSLISLFVILAINIFSCYVCIKEKQIIYSIFEILMIIAVIISILCIITGYSVKTKMLFDWYDMWVGFFWDSKKKWLYILPIPTVGIILKFCKGEIVNEDIQNMLPDGYILTLFKTNEYPYVVHSPNIQVGSFKTLQEAHDVCWDHYNTVKGALDYFYIDKKNT